MSTSKENKQVGEVTIPENVKIIQEGNIIIVEGKNGKIKKDFTKIPIKLVFEDNKIMIHPPGQRRKDLALINTVKSIISSMIKGVETGFTYKLKIIFSHFPISVKVKDKKVIVENYFGERSSRISKIVGDTQVEISGEDVIVKGPSLEDVSQTATNIESSTKIKNKDQRVFLDGVYVYAKQDGL
ncbi:MAG TPA: 50S ribosomal protein L6 [Nitrososphaeraceae archaeon]|jgi:large subunit ribosomal protein L6|nr:50S ribosomal protein L6 [Nitrososphaeraceae archaeon]